MTDEEKIEDLGVRIGTPEQVIWETVLKETSISIENLEKALIVQHAMKIMAQDKIAFEKAKVY